MLYILMYYISEAVRDKDTNACDAWFLAFSFQWKSFWREFGGDSLLKSYHGVKTKSMKMKNGGMKRSVVLYGLIWEGRGMESHEWSIGGCTFLTTPSCKILTMPLINNLPKSIEFCHEARSKPNKNIYVDS